MTQWTMENLLFKITDQKKKKNHRPYSKAIIALHCQSKGHFEIRNIIHAPQINITTRKK